VNAVFEALMNFQAIELIIKKCIIMSYEIISITCSSNTTLTPQKEALKQSKIG